MGDQSMQITIFRALIGAAAGAVAIGLVVVAVVSWLSGTEAPRSGNGMDRAQSIMTDLAPTEKARGERDGNGGGHAANGLQDRKSGDEDRGADKAAKAANGRGHEAEFERGPNGGRLLKDGSFALELTIFEAGQEPQFRVYPYLDGQAIDPSKVDLEIELARLGGKTDHFDFEPQAAYLAGDGVVAEPHSFDVHVHAEHDGQSFEWSYPSYEGRTTIPATAAREARLATEPAGSAVITETIEVLGRVDFAPGAKAILRARFPGPVLDVLKAAGDRVEAGDAVVRVESNESLVAYDIKSPMKGVVIEQLANPGDLATDGPLMVVGDPVRLIADFHIFDSNIGRVHAGQTVIVSALDRPLETSSEIAKVLPTKQAATQTVIARVPLANPDGKWRPGAAVTGVISVRQAEVPLAVRTKALQRFGDFTVVFAKVGDTYEVRMLQLGRRTPEWTEVLGGIDPGQEYVVENSFLIKADIEKSGTSHAH